MNCEIQNYSLGPQCSTHRDSWKNTKVDMGKERGTCVLPFAFFMCVIALLGISPVPVHPKQIICPRATSESPPNFCCPFIYQWTSRPILYTVLHSGLQQSWGFRQSPSYSFHFLRMQPEVEWSIFRFCFALVLRMCFPAYLYGTVCMQVPIVTRSRHQIPWIWRII